MSTEDKFNKLSDAIAPLIEALDQPGEHCDYGWPAHDVDSAYEEARKISVKPICAISEWIWWDLECNESTLNFINQQGLLTAMVKSNYVISDEAGRFKEGHWLRSSLLQQFHRNAFFESQNTLYILINNGTRRSIPIEVATSYL